MVASAFPLAEVALRVADERSAAEVGAREAGEGNLPTVDDLPFSDSEEGSLPPTSSDETGGLAGLDGASSRPADANAAFQDRAGASGSVILSQVLGAAKVMGHGDVEIPELPVARLAAQHPLRAAILEWIAATGAIVPADELTTQLARADAMPVAIQRDVALLLLSATDATLLQRAALANLRPEELAWIYSHPEVAEDLVAGVDSDDTRAMAALAAKVDMKQSVAATLLVLQAIEATRGSLSKAEAAETIDKLNAGDLDETTRAIMQLLATAQSGSSDKDKVLLAANLVALSAGVDVPAAGPAPSFADALAALTSASHQVPDTAALATVLARAKALPDDLEGAIARLLMAEANAINAANPMHFTPTSQPQALVNVLVATAQTLPVLEKYGFYWRAAPAALRMGEWDPSSRLGWAAHHGALLVTARNDITDLASVAPILSGHSFATAPNVPERSFLDAYLAVSKEARFAVTDQMMADLSAAAAALDPAVRDAAAILLSGAAESARLHQAAFARLTPDEKRFLLLETDGLDALYTAPTISEADLARLQRATALSLRVDADKLAQSGVVATLATAQAKEILEGRDVYSAQASAVTHVATGLRGLLARLSPIGTARAQPDPCRMIPDLLDCDEEKNILLRLYYPTLATGGFTPAEYVAFQGMGMNVSSGESNFQRTVVVGNDPRPQNAVVLYAATEYAHTCDPKECRVEYPFPPDNTPYPSTAGEATRELLVITGDESETYTPENTVRWTCPAVLTFYDLYGNSANEFSTHKPVLDSTACRLDDVPRYGAATIHLDLGGNDVYRLPVGMVHINASLPVSLMLDMGGDDRYADPSSLYDGASPLLRDLGSKAGHPSQASAVYGGVAILVDSFGDDNYAATSRSQGFARLGLALLADLAGEDIYDGRDFMQGASSETFTLGAAILFDQAGNDDYTAMSGQGFGLGGVLLDVGGLDVYRNEHDAMGVPIVHLNVLPGGDVSTLDARADNRLWLDGPGSINVGIGIDQEAILTTGDDDSDTWPDVIEFIVGTDPEDRTDHPQSNPATRAAALTEDSDFDGYPDYVERALSTDPEDGSSYPAGFPAGVAVNVPAEVMGALPPLAAELLEIDEDGRLAPFENTEGATGSNFTSSDKIIDLRLPLQNAGTIDYGCTGEYYPNATAPVGPPTRPAIFRPLQPGQNVLLFINGSQSEDRTTGGPERTADGKVFERCVRASYATTEPGQGNASLPDDERLPTNARTYPFTFQIPAGILAVGDIVDTNYTADYFVTIDLGGSDDFWNSAGGALIVQTRPIVDEAKGQEDNDAEARTVTNTFIAPALTISVDLNETTSGVVESGDPKGDRYDNDSRDFAHGSYFGVLVDTDGEDLYRARDGSQGTMGGVLLDLAGSDTYAARDLSQGAGLAATAAGSLPGSGGTPPQRPVQDLPNGGDLPADEQGPNGAGAARRALPGILLDFSNVTTLNTFTARSHSQGFARGYPGLQANANSAPVAYGILATLGESSIDKYDTYSQKGRYSQGVGGVDGVGILLDRGGSDAYTAWSLVSQGSTISQRVYTQDDSLNTAPHTATGILADLGGFLDQYMWNGGLRTFERQNAVTISRADSATSTTNAGRVYADLGIHIDAVVDPANPTAALESLSGTQGQQSFLGAETSTTSSEQFHVYMPTARLAIGKNTATTYSKEFAFVVDLGGANQYLHNAGGFVRDVLAEANWSATGAGAQPVTSVYGATANLFPVTLVVDAGLGNSTYNTSATFAQGAGYFGVGIVADLGGRDVFRARERSGESHASGWVLTPPIIDADVGGDWGGIATKDILLRSLEDERFTEPWKLRVANDASALYIALEGRTNGATDDARKKDVLILDLDMGRRQQEWDYKANRTGIDQIVVAYDLTTARCVAFDRAWNDTYHNNPWSVAKGFTIDTVQAGGLTVDCRFTQDGKVFYEIKKDLLSTFPYDFRDLAYCYNEDVGFGYATNSTPECEFPANELGLLVRFADTGAGYYAGGCSNPACEAPAYFSWPMGAVDGDGDYGHRHNGNISDEMTEWAAIGLAQLGENGASPKNSFSAAFSQGAGLAGVGVVALLGTHLAESQMHAGNQAQAYAAYGGLGVVIDAAGSDKYVSNSHSLGAAQTRGVALFLEMEGNDNYLSRNASLGWSPVANNATTASDGGSAVFLDLAGDDEYRAIPLDAQRVNSFRGALAENAALPSGASNNVFWVQNQSVGADYRVIEAVRQSLADATVQSLFGQTRTRFLVTQHSDTVLGPWGNGCTTQEVEKRGAGGFDIPDFVVRGKVCFVATVDVGNGIVARLPVDAPQTVEGALAQLSAGTNGAAPAMKVDVAEVLSVDFLVDRARVNTTYTKIDVTPRITSWSSPVDLSEFADGVARGKALPVFAAQVGAYGTYIFQDSVSNAVAESNATTATRVLLIDNPPIPRVGLEPAYTGRANATFSPYAYGAQQNLYVNYSVNHDVGEDRYVQHNAFRANITNSSIPCVGLPAVSEQGVALCNILPFYLGTDGDTLTTEPGTDAGVSQFGITASPRVVVERIEDTFDAKTPALRTPLVIQGEDSFHLALPGRQGVQAHLNFTTSVRVFLENATGQQVLNETNQIWYLGEKVGYGGGTQVSTGSVRTTTVFDALGEAGRQAQGLVTLLNQPNVARAAVSLAYNNTCADPRYNTEQCRQLTGRLGPAGSFSMCGPGPANQDALARNLYAAWNAVNNVTKGTPIGPSTCRNIYDTLNATTDEHGNITGEAGQAVGRELNNATADVNRVLQASGLGSIGSGSSRVDNVNFTDFYFGVNKTPPKPAPSTNHCADVTKAETCVRLDGSGNMVIPTGFKLALEFELKAPSECPLDLCAITDEQFEFLADTVNNTVAGGSAASGVNLYNPTGLSNLDPINSTIVAPMRQQNGDVFRQQPPGAIFYVKSGPPGDQPRFEVRVPAEPTTDVTVTIDHATTEEPAVVLRSGGKLVGDRPGTPTRDGVLNATYWAAANETPHANWTVNNSGLVGRWTKNTLTYNDPELADGLYNVRVTATDATQQTVSRTDTLLVDRTAPLTLVRTDVFTGKATLRAGAIPIDWAVFEQGSGLREVWLYTREGTAGDVSDIGTWKLVDDPTTPGDQPFPPNVRSHLHSKSATENTYLFMTIGVDRAGNVEGVQSTIDDPISNITVARQRAFAAKIALGHDVPHGYRKVFLDQSDPLFSSVSIVGGKLVGYQGSDFTFVRAGVPISFGICARDPESGIGLVNLSLDHIDPQTGVLKTITFVTEESGACDDSSAGGRLFVNNTWHTMNQNPTAFPEGVWSITFDLFDRAGNKLPITVGNLILDHSSPAVQLEAPVLPTGQSAVKPGDAVKIRLVATDDFGVDEGGIRVDASSFAKNASALKTRSVRVNGVIYQEASFTVDLPNLQNGVFDVTVKVPDLAGNLTIVKTQIAVNFKPFQFVPGSLRASNVTHNALTLHWKTDEPTSALAKFGTTSIALTGRTPQDINATIDHALRVEGLAPSTHYFLRAVAVSAGGFTKESELIEVDTASALFLSPISPVAGGKVSGLVPIKFRGGLLDSADFVTYTLEVRDSPTKPWTFVTTATRQGDSHELSWNSTRFLDGRTYELRLTAEAGRDESVLIIDRLTSDNTPPNVLVLTPLLATNDTTPNFTAEASDALSGLALAPATLYIDGMPIAQNLSVEPLTAGRLRYTHTFPLPLAPGLRTFELRVADLAGNVAKEMWKVAIDGDAPNVTVNPTRYAPGTAAAKQGGTVTLNLTIEDLSGVAHVVADASGLNPLANETRLIKLVNTNNWQGTISVTAGEESATKAVAIRAVDLAGNVRTLTVNVPLDNVAPQVAATSIVAIGHRRAVIDVPADEQILVNGTATASASPAVTAATSDAATTARLTFDGLLPSRTYHYRLTAVDRAGNPVALAGSFATLQDTQPPSALGPLSVLDLLNGTLRITWAPATDDVLVSHYRVYRSDDGVTFRLLAETPSNVYEDWGLPYEKTYVYKVAAVDFGANEGIASPSLSAAATAVPHLTVGAVTPTVGTTTTTFRYSVTYLSPGGVAPAYVRVILDGVPQNMSLESGDARTGAVYTYETRLAPHKRDAPHTYAYEASDGRYTVRFPEDGSVVRGPLVSGDILGDGSVGGFGAFAQRVPLGGVAGVALAFVAALGVAALIRRKKEGSK